MHEFGDNHESQALRELLAQKEVEVEKLKNFQKEILSWVEVIHRMAEDDCLDRDAIRSACLQIINAA